MEEEADTSEGFLESSYSTVLELVSLVEQDLFVGGRLGQGVGYLFMLAPSVIDKKDTTAQKHAITQRK